MSSLATPPVAPGIESRYVDCKESVGLNFHILEAGDPGKPLILLVHGYPELSFSWRKIMLPLASHGSGYHVVALDQRGYGRTTGWDNSPYEKTDLKTFKLVQLVTDVVACVNAIGHHEAHCIVGHDFGTSSRGCYIHETNAFERRPRRRYVCAYSA